MSAASSALFQPLRLGSVTLKNRITSTAHAPAHAEDGKPKERYQAYHEEKAKGGLALTMFGGSSNVRYRKPGEVVSARRAPPSELGE